MANAPETELPVSFFQPTDAATIARILERARTADARVGLRQSGDSRAASHSLLAQTLGKALAYHGRNKQGRPSTRPIAPSTGGRAFHFAHSTVTRGPTRGTGDTRATGTTSAAPGSTASSAPPAAAPYPAATTREGAHQAYIERDQAIAPDLELGHGIGKATGRNPTGTPDPAIERSRDLEPHIRPAPGRDQDASSRHPPAETDLSWVRERVAGQAGYGIDSSATAAQAYIENEQKTGNDRASSFGTIGATAAERLEFWDLVNSHESAHGGRTQSRLVLELPHEASPAARHEIVRRYARTLEDAGIPYWAAIHAPTSRNDSRNHHAHIVYIDRPARQMPHPTTGARVWDFTISESYKTGSRNTRVRYPYRQNRSPEMRAINYVTKARARFAAITNDVMGECGCAVRYDSRSYKDMGLDVEPIKHVTRVLSDKMKLYDFVVMDAAWTRTMIQQETQAAAQNRDSTLLKLRAVEGRLTAVAQSAASINTANRSLSPRMRLSPTSTLTRRAAAALTTRILTAERERLLEQFAAEATRRTLTHIIEATAPHKSRSVAHPRAYPKNADAPDPEVLRSIHEATMEELRLFDAWAANRRTGRRHATRAALDAWDEQARPRPAAPAAAPDEPARPHRPDINTALAQQPSAASADARRASSGMPAQGQAPAQSAASATQQAPQQGPPPQAAAAQTRSSATFMSTILQRMAAMAASALETHVQGTDPSVAIMASINAEIMRRAQARAAADRAAQAASTLAESNIPPPPSPSSAAQSTRAAAHDAPVARDARPQPATPAGHQRDPAAASARTTSTATSHQHEAGQPSGQRPSPQRPAPPTAGPRATTVDQRTLDPTPPREAPRPPKPPNFMPPPGSHAAVVAAYERAMSALTAIAPSAVLPKPPEAARPDPTRAPIKADAARPGPVPSARDTRGDEGRAASPSAPASAPLAKPDAPSAQRGAPSPETTETAEQPIDQKKDKKRRKAKRRAILFQAQSGRGE